MPKPIKSTVNRTPRTKWKYLDGPKGEQLLKAIDEHLQVDLSAEHLSAEGMWSKFEEICRLKATNILGSSKGAVSTGKDPTWWNDTVKEALASKKTHFKIWQCSQLDADKETYREAKKSARISVAQERSKSNQTFYENLENAKTVYEIFKLARYKNRNTMDIKTNKYIKDKDLNLLTNNEEINKRWFDYYQQLLNEEFPSEDITPLELVVGPIPEISFDETNLAVSKMKNHKAIGPDEVPADLWKRLGNTAIIWLTKLFNIVPATKRIPESWRQSYLVPFYKNKGDVAQCENYRGIKLTSHTLKVWERILNRRLSALSNISENQFGFRASKSTTDAIQGVRILMEKYKLNKKDLHLFFLDLEKAFDRVPRELVWQALRAQNIPEHYVNLVQDMYHNVSTKVRSLAGLSKSSEVKL